MLSSRRFLLWLLAVAPLGLCALSSHAGAAGKGPLVFAAASLKDALDAVNRVWREQGGNAVISYGGSPSLAKQIEAGAPADLFLSADPDWMNYLQKRNLIRLETRVNLFGNSLVLIAPKGASLTAKIEPGFPLAALIGDGRLAMANTDSVPAGKYGKAALTKLGVWDAVKDKIAQAENVRAALLLVSRGEAPVGVVYATDARADPKVEVIGIFPEDTHPPIVYPAAVLAEANSPDAKAFIAFLKLAPAIGIFEAQGFKVLSNP